MTWTETFVRDLRHGSRLFARQPGTNAARSADIDGIGANAVIFSFDPGGHTASRIAQRASMGP